MLRKRLTKQFPFLLSLRQKQKKLGFYIKMYFDRNQYATKKVTKQLPYLVFETDSLLQSKNSGFDMKYQLNKVNMLQLAAKTINHIVINPGETFSFWQLVRFADRYQPNKDVINISESKITGTYEGGLYQLSNMLFWLFLHTPLTIVERHGHSVEAFPTSEELPDGTDAAVSEGWLDLKVKNNTTEKYQIEISFEDGIMHGQIRINHYLDYSYEVFNQNVFYVKKANKVYQSLSVWQRISEAEKDYISEQMLYSNICEIGYHLPENIPVMELDSFMERSA